MALIAAEKLEHEYIRRDEDGNPSGIIKAVDGITLEVEKGEFVAVLGGNGSGKSTFAKHINAILYPTGGTLLFDGKDTKAPGNLWDIRQKAGMIFQNPDNQIIGNVVEEDVGFGPENIGVPTDEIWERVKNALRAVDMYQYRRHSPNKLSGGQKQRVAIAGVLAMKPECLIMDEPTAMLDPEGRREVINAVRELNSKEKITVILITHYMEEVIHADRVFILDKGRIAMTGSPREIFSRVDELKALRLCVPQATELSFRLKEGGLPLPLGILSVKELSEDLVKLYREKSFPLRKPGSISGRGAGIPSETMPDPEKDVLILDHVTYTYGAGTSYEINALNDLSLTIRKGDFIGLIGHTGSGKSTLVQHLNGLLKASSGHIYYKGEDIYEKSFSKAALRSHVGLVFQYPEHQLFEETVFKDVCFGPKNLGLSGKEAELRAYEALKSVRFPDDLFYVSPFELSGGQKRRAAIAGVLAMKPDILVLDEPTAGLDPAGRDEILDLISELHSSQGITIVLVSHSMEDVADYVNRILVMNKGSLLMDGKPEEVFRRMEELAVIGLAVPEVKRCLSILNREGLPVDPDVTTVDAAVPEILKAFGMNGEP